MIVHEYSEFFVTWWCPFCGHDWKIRQEDLKDMGDVGEAYQPREK